MWFTNLIVNGVEHCILGKHMGVSALTGKKQSSPSSILKLAALFLLLIFLFYLF